MTSTPWQRASLGELVDLTPEQHFALADETAPFTPDFTEPPEASQPEPAPAPEPEPVLEPGPDRDSANAALAAEVAARDEEVAGEIAADLDAFLQAETAFLVEADASIAAERLWAQDHNPVALAAINSRLESAQADIAGIVTETCSRYRRAA